MATALRVPASGRSILDDDDDDDDDDDAQIRRVEGKESRLDRNFHANENNNSCEEEIEQNQEYSDIECLPSFVTSSRGNKSSRGLAFLFDRNLEINFEKKTDHFSLRFFYYLSVIYFYRLPLDSYFNVM